MLDKLNADFDKILDLVQRVPDPLKETALKTILENWFSSNTRLLGRQILVRRYNIRRHTPKVMLVYLTRFVRSRQRTA